jgi:hypothetical protein
VEFIQGERKQTRLTVKSTANMTESHACRQWPEGQRRIPFTLVLQRVGAVSEGMFVDLILDLRQ